MPMLTMPTASLCTVPGTGLDLALTDGENLERLWSYLGRFCKMTKEMNPAHRIDTLADALCYYSHQKCGKMGKIGYSYRDN